MGARDGKKTFLTDEKPEIYYIDMHHRLIIRFAIGLLFSIYALTSVAGRHENSNNKRDGMLRTVSV